MINDYENMKNNIRKEKKDIKERVKYTWSMDNNKKSWDNTSFHQNYYKTDEISICIYSQPRSLM